MGRPKKTADAEIDDADDLAAARSALEKIADLPPVSAESAFTPNVEPKQANLPKRTDPEWSDYVLSHLTEDETFNGNPTVDGLWRISELFLGELISFRPEPVQTPNSGNGYAATVVYHARFRSGPKSEFCEFDSSYQDYAEVSDANPQNTTEEFARHASAMAATRAAGRMLRRALGLKKTVTAEEMTAPPIEKRDMDGNPTFITHSQFVMLNTLAKRFNVNAKAYVDRYTEYYHQAKYDEIGKVPYTVAQEMIPHIQKYGQGKDKDSLKPIPEDCIGYKADFEASWSA